MEQINHIDKNDLRYELEWLDDKIENITEALSCLSFLVEHCYQHSPNNFQMEKLLRVIADASDINQNAIRELREKCFPEDFSERYFENK